MTAGRPWNEVIPFQGERIELRPEVPGATTGVVYLNGQLTTENSPAVMAHLRKVLSSATLPDTIVLDLRDLRYASSTGIGVIAKLLVDLQNRSITLELANAGENVRGVFDLLGFSAFFQFVDRP